MRIRCAISEKIFQITRRENVFYELEVPVRKQQNPAASSSPIIHWTLPKNEEKTAHDLANLIKPDNDVISSVRLIASDQKNASKIEFQLQPQAFTAAVLERRDYRALPAPFRKQNHIVLEFSSPNIAKPFHVGHLRSTIIGNVLSNMHRHMGHRVTTMNYLGDWGTQCGLLQVGVQLKGITDEQVRQKPIETLYQAYVAAHIAAKTDPTIVERARQHFTELETGKASEGIVRQWHQYRQYTIDELKNIYDRLGVRFDQYEWESQYSQQQISDVLQRLNDHALLITESDGKKVVRAEDGRHVPIMKSDGSTLYLARDIAALVARFESLKFDKILYVVENGQGDHFKALFPNVAKVCNLDSNLFQHVKFGRIHGMSTRNGKVVFLRDVLDEARDIMLEKQLNSSTTKLDLSQEVNEYKSAADILGVSAVIVNDLKQRRQRDYDFDWNKALQVNGDTGIKLQYTHCRLHSLLDTMKHISLQEANAQAEYLQETHAQELLLQLARFDQAIWMAQQQLEACVLVNYLFILCNTTSRALKSLRVKDESNLDIQKNRLLLFAAAKRTLKCGMEILGLQILNKM